MKKQTKQPVKTYVIRGTWVLLTLALGLWVVPFAPGQRSLGKFGRPLTFPSSLPGQQQPKSQQVQTAPDSVRNRHLPVVAAVSTASQAPVSKQAKPAPAPSMQAVPSGIDCNSAPGIVI